MSICAKFQNEQNKIEQVYQFQYKDNIEACRRQVIKNKWSNWYLRFSRPASVTGTLFTIFHIIMAKDCHSTLEVGDS